MGPGTGEVMLRRRVTIRRGEQQQQLQERGSMGRGPWRPSQGCTLLLRAGVGMERLGEDDSSAAAAMGEQPAAAQANPAAEEHSKAH